VTKSDKLAVLAEKSAIMVVVVVVDVGDGGEVE
jgi:hypothetical protein